MSDDQSNTSITPVGWDAQSLIIAKRDGGQLPDEAIDWFIDGYTAGRIPDYQVSAMLMAVFLNGLSGQELTRWTNAMIDSGERFDLAGFDRPIVDKHSTGGVGDKVSLILCPLVAACGAVIPQVAGRGLGHTGGTLDKLEAIPGWNATVAPDRFTQILTDVGAIIAAASDNLAPADRKLYALRDVTGTVASIPLIASSIMSKKIASGTQALVLDVKVGKGAFMRELDDARELAQTMVDIGNRSGVKTVALLTAMDQPLGRMVGNTNEVDESIEVLAGGGPADLVEIVVALAREMLTLVGIDADPAEVLASGRAEPVWREMIAAQGGDLSAARERAVHQHEIVATSSGWMTDLDALDVGVASMRLGAGRATKEDDIDFGAGIECLVKPGEPVTEGQPVLRLHSNRPETFAVAAELLADAVAYSATEPSPSPLIIERVG
ncbi:MAG: thymidine phosphorylase [Acidimicrobiales bacterium]